MALMYRPRNSHCIYVDRKSDKNVLKAASAIVECYREVFVKVSTHDHMKRNVLHFFISYLNLSNCLFVLLNLIF